MTDQERRVMDLAAAILNVFREDDSVLEKQVALGVAAAALHLSLADEGEEECSECGEYHELHGASN